MSGKKLTGRRTVLKTIPATIAGVGVVGAISGSAQADDNITTLGQNDDQLGDNAYIELSVSGPSSTSVQTNTMGIAWAMNHDYGIYGHFKNTTLEFDIKESWNPADSTIDWVEGYSQGTGGITAEHVDYALDTLWAASPIPTPSPFDVTRDSGLDIDRPGSSFTHDLGGWDDKISEDATGGAHFNVSLGTDGSLEDGLYSFEATLSTDVYRQSGFSSGKVGELEAKTSCALVVDT
ncbi:hypothetical protein [Haloterrigena salifodinae]|uniref:hypothetical protein n=1 Tax=Haloterrigena salifodinae TaxID=2675099 RepID=UPI000F89C82A|nr:hypothetical protein [Haloterrigena salifodinae]